jgi:hypothetical protein
VSLYKDLLRSTGRPRAIVAPRAQPAENLTD